MHRPYITMACVVHCKGKFLFVEEIEYDKRTLNQPAGHLEENETIIEGAQRELYEETGIRATMQKLVKIYQWHAPLSQKDYLRFVFAVELEELLPITPHDADITQGFWLTLDEFEQYIQQPEQCARNPLVIQAVKDYLAGESYPLEMLTLFE
ncbi:NUDIX domain-containing protein [Pasteurellaceae bacterium 22721_9_1]